MNPSSPRLHTVGRGDGGGDCEQKFHIAEGPAEKGKSKLIFRELKWPAIDASLSARSKLPCLTPAEREARPFKPRSSQVSSLKFPFLAGPYTGNLLQSVVMAAEHTPLPASVAPALAGCSYAAIDSVVHFK